MYRSAWFGTAVLSINWVLAQPAIAISAAEVGDIATAITVEIKSVNNSKIGSGILLQQQGDIYTVLTAAHVVQGSESMTLKTSDGKVHQSLTGSIKQSANSLDLAILKFKSSKSYRLTKIGTSNNLKLGSIIYVAGFPEPTYAVTEPGLLNLTKGEVIGKGNTGNARGYSLIYSNITRAGMSGGPVLNDAGELVAIHGQGDREGTRGDGEKIGRNLGIVVERFGKVASTLGIQLNSPVAVLPTPQVSNLNAADYFLTANDKVDRGDYAGALADFNRSISINSKYANAFINRGNLKRQHFNDTPGAFADYNRAIAISPQNSAAYNNRGVLKNESNDIPGALADYNQAIALDSEYAEAYTNRGVLKIEKLNDLDGALADYNQAIKINPQFAGAYTSRGNLQSRQGNISAALADFQRAIILNPKDANAYNSRGTIKFKSNDLDGALADYNQAISLNPKFAGYYSNRGILKNERLNDVPGALADYNRAIALDPKQADAYSGRGTLKFRKLKDKQGALADYNRAIALDPTDPVVYGNRGFLKKDMFNDRNGAIQDFRQAARLFRARGQTTNAQRSIDLLKELGASE
jgi:tetratricopeptide (TPR) repeat protein